MGGYNVKVLPKASLNGDLNDSHVKKEGACLVNSMIVYQILSLLKSQEYEKDKLSIMLTQFEGVCEERKFIEYLKKNLEKAGFKDIPIITLDIYELNTQIGFRLASIQFKRIITSFMYSDILTMMVFRVKPYVKPNDKEAFMFLLDLWIKRCEKSLEKADFKDFENDVFEMTEDFSAFPIDKNIEKQKLGIVGNSLVIEALTDDVLEGHGLEIVRTNLSDLFFYKNYKKVLDSKVEELTKLRKININYISQMLKRYKDEANQNLERNDRYDEMIDIDKITKEALLLFPIDNNNPKALLNLVQIIGLIEQGVEKIVLYRCSDCFRGTLGKKIINKMKATYENVNIIQVEHEKNFNVEEEIDMLNSAFIDAVKKDVV